MRAKHVHLFPARLSLLLALFSAFMAVAVKADLPPPPPPAIVQTIPNAPHGINLDYDLRGYRPYNPPSRPSPAQYESVKRALHGTRPDLLSGLTGHKTHPIRLTDNYGNTARGQIRTATTMSGGVLDAAVKGYVVAELAGRVVNSPNAHNAAEALANGRYGEAALSAAAALDVMNIGGGINGLIDTYRQAQNAKTAALVAEHQQAAQTYEQVKNLPKVYVVYMNHRQGSGGRDYPGYGIHSVYSEPIILSGGQIVSANGNPRRLLGEYPFMVDGLYVSYFYHVTEPTPEMFYKPVTPEELMLNQQEIAQILLDQLHNNNSALNQNTQALTDLLNALVSGGHLDPSKQPTQVLGSPAENTFLTPPFTPAGSNQAQQTQFIVNSDGSVTVSQIQRPDLAANTSQAPTRAEVGQHAPSPAETRDAKQGSTAEKPDICAQNPNSLMCADIGSSDYSDPVLPEKQIDLDFKPADIFAKDGVCPAPIAFEVMGSRYEISYEPACKGARAVRPIFILIGMLIAMSMCYNAVKEL